MKATNRLIRRALPLAVAGIAGLLSAGVAPAEVMSVSTLYTQPINPTNAVHPLWTPVQHYRGMTFVVCPDLQLRPMVTQIDRAGAVTTVFLDTGTNPVYTASTDGHNRFTMGIDKHGYLHIIGDMHGYAPWASTYVARYQYQSILYWKSNKALDVTGGFSFCGGLNSTTRLPGVEWGGDSRFFNDRNGELYFSSRVRAFEGGPFGGSEPFIAYGMYRYNVTNGVWSALGGSPASDAPGAKNYNVVLYWEYTLSFEAYQSQPRFDNSNRLHFAIGGNTAGTTGNGLIYACSDDGGATWKKANGQPIPGLPLRGKDGEEDQGDLIIRARNVAQQAGVSIDQNGKLNVAGWTWAGTNWTNISGGSGMLGPDDMLTAEGGSVLKRASAIGERSTAYDTGFGQVFSTSELGLQTEGAIYGIGLPPGFNFPTATNMSVYKATFTGGGNVATGGVASASAGTAPQAFDGNPGTKWYAQAANAAWLQYNFGPGLKRAVFHYELISGHDAPARDPRDWQLQASDDGKSWTTLDTRAGEVFPGRNRTKRYRVANSAAHQIYRLNMTANQGGATDGLQLGELALMAVDTSSAPTAPRIFLAQGDNNQVWLSWTVSERATSYQVKRANRRGGPYTTIATGVTNPGDYADTGRVNGTPCYYVVSAVNSAGESPNSPEASATPMDQPLAPIIQSAVGGNACIVLTWLPLWPHATSYNIKRAPSHGGPYVTVAKDVTGLSYTNTGLLNDTNYYYVVSASNARSGESAPSTPIVGTPFRWVPILKYKSVGYNPAVQGVASASAENVPLETAARAFDGNLTSKWLAMAHDCWLQYQFTNGASWAVTRYEMVSGGDGPERDPKDWQLLGSNDGTQWTTLDTQTGQTFAARRMTRAFIINNPTAYSHYRLKITANRGNGITQLAELVLWADGQILPVRSGF